MFSFEEKRNHCLQKHFFLKVKDKDNITFKKKDKDNITWQFSKTFINLNQIKSSLTEYKHNKLHKVVKRNSLCSLK